MYFINVMAYQVETTFALTFQKIGEYGNVGFFAFSFFNQLGTYMRMGIFRLFIFVIALNFAVVSLAAEKTIPQVSLITQLYQDFAFEAAIEDATAIGFIDRPKKVLLRYLTPQLTELMLKDRRCATTTHEICRLDFMPLWGSQDPAGFAVQVRSGVSPDIVVVLLHHDSSTIELNYFLAKSSAGWKIRDISYGQARLTLAGILKSTL